MTNKTEKNVHPVLKTRQIAVLESQKDWPFSHYVGMAGAYLEGNERSILGGDFLIKNVTNSPGMVNLFSACDLSDNNTHLRSEERRVGKECRL